MIKKRGRNLLASQAQAWTEDWFNGHGLYRLRGTIRYPKAALTIGNPALGGLDTRDTTTG
jgi:hypothetical protein